MKKPQSRLATWQLRIQDPAGEMRLYPLENPTLIGRALDAHVRLRDPMVAPHAARITPFASEANSATEDLFWFKVPDGAPDARLGDLQVRDAALPPGLTLRLGETRIVLERKAESGSEFEPALPAGFRPWLTCSDEGRRTRWLALKAAGTPLSVYLAGETGVGKEVLAHLLHAWSERASGPFVPLHCAALPMSLIESELFGHVKGAFTGADQQRPGALMQAHGGTLFLDEIGDLPMDIQVKLLRFLENGEIRPVGSDRLTRANARIVCATHQPLLKLVEEGKFRRDLYYRLASISIEIPPLRSRPEDVEFLALRFATELNKSLSPRALRRLQAHEWPGNVRELRHAIERASGLADPFAPVLEEDAFSFLLTPENISRAPSLELGLPVLGLPVLSLREMERAMILKALRLANGHRSEAAALLGVARSTLFEMLKRHHIIGPRSDNWRAAEPAWTQATISLEK